MYSLKELNNELTSLIVTNPAAANNWFPTKLTALLTELSKMREGRAVLLYGSAFLQKPHELPQSLMINTEDLNGLMTTVHGLDCKSGLTLILHTPGGMASAPETLVSYLRSKFNDIEVIVPTYAMSAGTMIALSANRIFMGRQSQLGPIDPQMNLNGKTASAFSILDQFQKAKDDINANPKLAHLYAPILTHFAPALVQEAQNAITYGESVVKEWLEKYMFAGSDEARKKANDATKHFSNVAKNKPNHGRRIDINEARAAGLIVQDLESNQSLQDIVLGIYHVMTMLIEKSPTIKIIFNNQGSVWVKNSAQQIIVQQPLHGPIPGHAPIPGVPGQPLPSRAVPMPPSKK